MPMEAGLRNPPAPPAPVPAGNGPLPAPAVERVLLQSEVEADDTLRHAVLRITERRVLVEYGTREEFLEAIWEAKFMGDDIAPFPVNLAWDQIARVQFVERYTGPHLLKIEDRRGRATLWKSYEARTIAEAIRRGMRLGRLEAPTVDGPVPRPLGPDPGSRLPS
jgi:hypothetical protein